MSCVSDLTDTLLEKVRQAIAELEITPVKEKKRTKKVEYDSENGKTARETITETEKYKTQEGNIDSAALKQLTAALKDIKAIASGAELSDSAEGFSEFVAENILPDTDTVFGDDDDEIV